MQFFKKRHSWFVGSPKEMFIVNDTSWKSTVEITAMQLYHVLQISLATQGRILTH